MPKLLTYAWDMFSKFIAEYFSGLFLPLSIFLIKDSMSP